MKRKEGGYICLPFSPCYQLIFITAWFSLLEHCCLIKLESLIFVKFTHLKHLFFVLEDLFSYVYFIFFEVYIVFLGYMLYLVLELNKQILKLLEFCS